MTPQTDELDRLIDALNAGDTPAVDALADPELAGLLNAVMRIRSLRGVNRPAEDSPDDDWPERAVRHLARDLRQPRVLDVLHVPVQAVAEERTPDDKTSDLTLVSMDRVRHQSPGRRRLSRELAQMAAAILVLVVVGGVLAITFRDQGQHQPGTIGSGAAIATPTSVSSSSAALPTPDAAGQYRNLTFAQAQQLAPFHLAQPMWVPSYLQAAGIVASVPNSTETQLTTPIANATPPTGPVQVVSMTFRVSEPKEFAVTIYERNQGTSLGPSWDSSTITGTTTITIAGHPVTRTSRASVATDPIPYPNTSYVWTDQGTTFQVLALVVDDPVTNQDVERMIASMLQPAAATATPQVEAPSVTPGVPTPDANGNYNWLTLSQAQQLAPFHLVQPTWTPSYLADEGIIASELKYTQINPTPTAGPVQVASLFFSGPATAKAATVTIGEVKQGAAVQRDTGTLTDLTIAGQTVSRTTWSDGTPAPTYAGFTGRHASYVWTSQGTTFQLEALLAGPVTNQDLEHMIASMIGQ